MRFHGNQLHHHTVVNESAISRVSIDIRVVARELYDPQWANPQVCRHAITLPPPPPPPSISSGRRTTPCFGLPSQGSVCFRLDEYYASVAVPGAASVTASGVAPLPVDVTVDEPEAPARLDGSGSGLGLAAACCAPAVASPSG